MAAEKKKTSVQPDKLRLYEKLVASTPGIESKSNFGAAYTAVNGNMYSLISKYGVVGIRLPEPDRSAFLEKYDATIFRADPAWPPNKEYVAVPDDLLKNIAALRPYLKASYHYAQTLRPKATTKKKACAEEPPRDDLRKIALYDSVPGVGVERLFRSAQLEPLEHRMNGPVLSSPARPGRCRPRVAANTVTFADVELTWSTHESHGTIIDHIQKRLDDLPSPRAGGAVTSIQML